MSHTIKRWLNGKRKSGWQFYCSNCKKWYWPRNYDDPYKTKFPKYCKVCKSKFVKSYDYKDFVARRPK